MITENKKANRAGLVCFNLAGQVLLVSAMSTQKQWVFPKGHIEADEEPFQTAERECREECGIIASTVGPPIGQTTFKYNDEEVIIEWFSGLASGLVDRGEDSKYAEYDWRTPRWFHWNKALEELAFHDMKEILKKALCFRS